MKKYVIFIALGLICTTISAQKAANSKLFVYYFHITQRCATCINIENTTKKVLEQFYQTKIDNGSIHYKAINIDLTENKEISEKYKVYGSTLLLVKIVNNSETVEDMTNFAFGKIHHEAIFTQGLKEKIDQLLK